MGLDALTEQGPQAGVVGVDPGELPQVIPPQQVLPGPGQQRVERFRILVLRCGLKLLDLVGLHVHPHLVACVDVLRDPVEVAESTEVTRGERILGQRLLSQHAVAVGG